MSGLADLVSARPLITGLAVASALALVAASALKLKAGRETPAARWLARLGWVLLAVSVGLFVLAGLNSPG